ncbi:Beta-xylosidase [Fusarium oxysporum f. sp. albedinis]|nr:Beta-xylosidase [Fusarium oxysporum f. sp. albedinis]
MSASFSHFSDPGLLVQLGFTISVVILKYPCLHVTPSACSTRPGPARTNTAGQFAEDWEQRIGNGATVRIPTYGV